MKRKWVLILLAGYTLSSSGALAQKHIDENQRRLAAKAAREQRQYHDIRPTPENGEQTFAIGSKYEPDVQSYLSARAAPSSRSRELFRIYRGATGLEVRGDSVMNGGTEWVPITVNGQQGWVAGHLLRPERD